MFIRRLLPALVLSSSAFAQILSSLEISPTNLGPGETATAKVTLSAPVGAAGLEVGVSISGQNATSPAAIAAPAGSTEITFPVTAANPLTKNEIVTVTASLGT